MTTNHREGENPPLTVTIFGRDMQVSYEELLTAATVLALLSAHESFGVDERNALWAAHDLVRQTRESLTTTGPNDL